MKNNSFSRYVAIVIIMFMVIAIYGCNMDSENFDDLSEYIFIAQTVSIPSDAGDFRGLFISGSTLYLTSETYTKNGGENSYSGTYADDIYSMNHDGTGFTKLENYLPPVFANNGISASSMIQAVVEANDGNIWVVEKWYRFDYDLPNGFDTERDNLYEYYVEIESGTTIRKLNSIGSEIFIVDIDSLQEQQKSFFVSSFEIDGSENLYICIDDWDTENQAIFVLDSTGTLQFQLKSKERIEHFIRLPDGTVAFAASQTVGVGSVTIALHTIDYASKDFGSIVNLPDIGRYIYSGSGDYDIFISDNSDLYGYSIEEEEAVKLLRWMDSDVANENISNLTMLSDEQIVCINQKIDRATHQISYDILVLTKTLRTEIPERTVITLGTFSPWVIRASVDEFNRMNSDYRIYVIDYSKYDTEGDSYAGHTRLRTELISGTAPDILDVTNFSINEYITKGLFTDLYPFIDSDKDINRDDFVQGVLKTTETNGSLYQVSWGFAVNTIIGSPAVVGSEAGWTMDEFITTLNANPEADIPFGHSLTKMDFLQRAVSFNIDEYIDWNMGTVYFDTSMFINILECAGRFNDEPDDVDHVAASTLEAIATGRQVMIQMVFHSFLDYQQYSSMFGGDIVFKGFPTESRNGNTLIADNGLAITEQSENKEAAWSFVRTFLSEDWQAKNVTFFPTNNVVFNQRAQFELEGQALQGEEITLYLTTVDEFGTLTSYEILQVKTLTQEDVDKITAVISSAASMSEMQIDEAIWNIISESASDYFSGACSAEDAAKVIQSRMSLLVSERS